MFQIPLGAKIQLQIPDKFGNLNWQNYLTDRQADRQGRGRKRERERGIGSATEAHSNWQLERLTRLVSFVSVVQRPLEGHLFGLRSSAASALLSTHRHLQAVGQCVCVWGVWESGQLKCFKVLHGQHINKCLHIYFVLPPSRLLPLASPHLVSSRLASIRCASCSQHVHNSTPSPCPCPCRGVLLSALFTCNLKLDSTTLPGSGVPLQSRTSISIQILRSSKGNLLRQ